MLIVGVGAVTAQTQTVERRYTERPGKVAVTAATKTAVTGNKTNVTSNTLGLVVQVQHLVVGLEQRSDWTSFDLHDDIRIDGLQRHHLRTHAVERVLGGHHGEHLRTTFDGHDIDEGPALDHTDAQGDVLVRLRHSFDGQHLLGHLTDCAAATRERRTGVRRTPRDLDPETGKSKSSGHQLALLGRLRHQHIVMLFRLLFDQTPRRRAAHFLVRHEHEGHRQVGLTACTQQLAQRITSGIHASLHVVYARCVDLVSLTPVRQRSIQGTDAVNSIQMAEHQDTGSAGFSIDSGQQHITIAFTTGATFRDAAEGRHLLLGELHHAVHALDMRGRTFHLHPALNALQDLIGVETRLVRQTLIVH